VGGVGKEDGTPTRGKFCLTGPPPCDQRNRAYPEKGRTHFWSSNFEILNPRGGDNRGPVFQKNDKTPPTPRKKTVHKKKNPTTEGPQPWPQ